MVRYSERDRSTWVNFNLIANTCKTETQTHARLKGSVGWQSVDELDFVQDDLDCTCKS